VARFDGGTISSDGGALLLVQVDKRLNLLARFGQCFLDGRNQALVEHSIAEMVSQGSTALLWATKTSTITSNCGPTRLLVACPGGRRAMYVGETMTLVDSDSGYSRGSPPPRISRSGNPP
jgi:hypothetical protein